MKAKTEDKGSENQTSLETQRKIWENLFFPAGYVLQEDRAFDTIIFFVIKGNLTVTFDEKEYHNICSKEMFLVPLDSPYRIQTLTQMHMMACWFSVESLYSGQKLIDELIPLCDTKQNDFSKFAIKEEVMRFLMLLSDSIRDGLDSPYFFEIKKNELNLLFSIYYTKEELARFLRDIISENAQFKKFVMDSYLSVRNVQELAELANYSTSGFIKKFQKSFRESPYQWIQKQKAKQILIEINRGVKSLQEIANEYKFSSYQHFAGFCKVQLGYPPTKIYGKNVFKKDI
jgi:AraC-like DNA-binding protein